MRVVLSTADLFLLNLRNLRNLRLHRSDNYAGKELQGAQESYGGRSEDLRDHRRCHGSAPAAGLGFLEPVYRKLWRLSFAVEKFPFNDR
jgi:hypothetical protein